MDNKKWSIGLVILVMANTVNAETFIPKNSISETYVVKPAISENSVPETFEWNGGYVGGFAGGTTKARITTSEPLRLDNNAYWFRPFHDSFTFKTRSSFIGGATLGYNYQMCACPFMLGLEGEYSYLSLRRRHSDPNQIPYENLPNNNLQNNSHNYINIGKSYGYTLIGARLGYVQDCLLFYVKSGVVFTRIQSKYDSVKTEDRMPAYLNLLGTKRTTGYGVGGGIEYRLPLECFSNFSTKIEYLFLGFNKKQYVYGHCSCHFLWRTIEKIRGVNTIKIGFNYNFR